MKNVLVSIIIPCYNSEAYVAGAIESALHQTHPNTEIILIDNNSADNTLAVLLGYKVKHPEKITVGSEERAGAAAARNAGLRMAKGQWVQFLDADDTLMPQKIEAQLARAVDSGAAVVVGSYRTKSTWIDKTTHGVENPWVGLITSRLGLTSSNLYKTESLRIIGGWKANLGSSQEYELMFRLLLRNEGFVYSRQVLTVIDRRSESLAKTSDKEKLYGLLKTRVDLRLQMRQVLSQQGMYDTDKRKALENYVFRQIIWSRYHCPEFYAAYVRSSGVSPPLLSKSKILLKEAFRNTLLAVLSKIRPLAKRNVKTGSVDHECSRVEKD